MRRVLCIMHKFGCFLNQIDLRFNPIPILQREKQQCADGLPPSELE
jgi:hypothetical protein